MKTTEVFGNFQIEELEERLEMTAAESGVETISGNIDTKNTAKVGPYWQI